MHKCIKCGEDLISEFDLGFTKQGRLYCKNIECDRYGLVTIMVTEDKSTTEKNKNVKFEDFFNAAFKKKDNSK